MKEDIKMEQMHRITNKDRSHRKWLTDHDSVNEQKTDSQEHYILKAAPEK